MPQNSKAKVGRRSRQSTRMPSTTYTASVEEILILMLMGEGNASLGIQKAVGLVTKTDPNLAALVKQARWMIGRAEEELGKDGGIAKGQEIEQKALYRYVADNYWMLVADYQANE